MKSEYVPRAFTHGEVMGPTQKSELVTTRKLVVLVSVKPQPTMVPGIPEIAPPGESRVSVVFANAGAQNVKNAKYTHANFFPPNMTSSTALLELVVPNQGPGRRSRVRREACVHRETCVRRAATEIDGECRRLRRCGSNVPHAERNRSINQGRT